HDDHKRWFTDIALFRKYVTPNKPKIKLLSVEPLLKEFKNSSKSALEKTLSFDSKKVVEFPSSEFYDSVRIGPAAKYKAVETIENGKLEYCVADKSGKIMPPEKCKAVAHPATGSKSILFYDEEFKCWVNPEIFYHFENEKFYEDNISFIDEETGLKITAVNAPSWHGIVSAGYVIETGSEKVYFSGDTVFNVELWKELSNKDLTPKYNCNDKEFADKRFITGDINDFIERAWSWERFDSAMKLYFRTDFMFHDSAGVKSIVHTDFSDCSSLDRNKTLLTHCPDKYVSKIPLTFNDKEYMIKNGKLFEITDCGLFELQADIYYKSGLRYYAGYKNPEGKFVLAENNGTLELKPFSESKNAETGFERYDLYEDIRGGYYSTDEKLSQKYLTLNNAVYEIQSESGGNIKLIVPEKKRR
nr:hypothetical protein [bacterium]